MRPSILKVAGDFLVAHLKQLLRDKFLLILVSVCALLSAIGLWEPADIALRASRVDIIPTQPSGDFVIVGVDNFSLGEVGTWPWPRSTQAKIIDQIFNSGADRLFIDVEYSPKAPKSENLALAAAIKAHKNKIYLFSGMSFTGEAAHYTYPSPEVAQGAQIFDGNAEIGFRGILSRMSYKRDGPNESVPGYSAALAQIEGNGKFPVNYGIDVSKVKIVSASQLLKGPLPSLKGKTVIFGATEPMLQDVKHVPFRGQRSGASIAVIGAETLLNGVPIDLGWLPLFFVGLGLALHFGGKIRGWKLGGLFIGVIGASVAVCWLGSIINIFVDATPGIVAFSVVTARMRFSSVELRSLIDRVSGLGNLEAAVQDQSFNDNTIIVVGIGNYAFLTQLLNEPEQKRLFEDICRRIRSAGDHTIYRVDGDCLAWSSDRDDFSSLRDHLEGVLALLRTPVEINGRSFSLGPNIVADVQTPVNVLGRVTASCELARQPQRGVMFREGLSDSDAGLQLTLGHELKLGLKRGDLWVAFQPQISTTTNEIVGAECLVRWVHPERGAIDPGVFIPLAEKSGLIHELTMFVLDQACQGAKKFQSLGLDIKVAVNLSPALFQKSGFVDDIIAMVRSAGVPSKQLKFELTESVNHQDLINAKHELKRLKLFGPILSADDYGTGLSTLENLRAVQVSELKVDKSFVKGARRSKSDRAFVLSIVNLADHLNMQVVAEGIEDAETLAVISELGCQMAQGYFIAKPMKLNDFIDLTIGDTLQQRLYG